MRKPRGGRDMKITPINNNNYKITFKSNPASEPAQRTATVVPTNIPADTIQFKQASVKPKRSFGAQVIDFIKDFAKEPEMGWYETMSDRELAEWEVSKMF